MIRYLSITYWQSWAWTLRLIARRLFRNPHSALRILVYGLCVLGALLSPASAQPLPIWTARHASAVSGLALSADESFVVTSSYDLSAKRWNATNGALTATYIGATRALNCVAVSWDGRVAAGSDAGELLIWNPSGSTWRMENNSARVLGVAFSADGIYTAAALDDGTIKIYNGTRTIVQPGAGSFRHVAAQPVKSTEPFACGFGAVAINQFAYEFDCAGTVTAYWRCVPMEVGADKWPLGCAYDPQGNLATVSLDGWLRLAKSGYILREQLINAAGCNAVAYSRAGNYQIVSDWSPGLTLLNPVTGVRLQTYTESSLIRGVAVANNGTLYYGCADGRVVCASTNQLALKPAPAPAPLPVPTKKGKK
jgi:hypothetical protein